MLTLRGGHQLWRLGTHLTRLNGRLSSPLQLVLLYD
jgi:hypothetical protein